MAQPLGPADYMASLAPAEPAVVALAQLVENRRLGEGGWAELDISQAGHRGE
jgi:hypothetical protein